MLVAKESLGLGMVALPRERESYFCGRVVREAILFFNPLPLLTTMVTP